MQTLPRTVQNAKSLATVLTQLSDLGVRTQEAFGLLIGPENGLSWRPAMKINGRRSGTSTRRQPSSVKTVWSPPTDLRQVESPTGARDQTASSLRRRTTGRAADRAATIADYSAIAAVLLAVIICAALFRRLVRSNETGKSSQAFAESILESSPRRDIRLRHGWPLRGVEPRDRGAHGPRTRRCNRTASTDTPAGLVDGALEARKAALRGHRVELENVVINMPQSQGREMSVIYAPLFDERERLSAGWDTSATSRSETRSNSRCAGQKLDAIGQARRGIAHDFNNLLMGIRGYASLALQRAPENDSVLRHNLDEILEGNYRARILTEQLLFFAGRRERRSDAVESERSRPRG